MKTITIEIPDDLAHQAGASDEDVAQDARLGLAILWYDRGVISQGKGAELAGLTRAEFIDELGRANVSAIQTSVDELREEMKQVAMRVVNASPLIHLARVSLLELLRGPDRGIAVIVPAVVLDEVVRGARHDPTGGLVEAAARDWLTVVPTPTPHPDINRARIDAGEIAVLSVARLAPGSATVVLDDRAARAEADRLRLPKTETLRLLLEAKALGIIPSVRAPLDVLRARGMRLSSDVWQEVLSLAEE